MKRILTLFVLTLCLSVELQASKAKYFAPFAAQTSATGERYGAPVGGTASAWDLTESNTYHIWAYAGTFRKIRVKLDAAPGAGKSYVVGIRINGVNSALSTTIADTDTTGYDSATDVAVAAGDTVSVRTTPSGTPALVRVSWEFEFEPTVDGNTQLGGSACPGTDIPAGTNYGGFSGFANFSTPESNRYFVMPTSGVIKGLYFQLFTDVGAGNTRTFAIRRNGSTVGTPVVTFAEGEAPAIKSDTSTELAVVAGDLLSLQSSETGTPVASKCAWGVGFIPTTPGDFVIHVKPANNLSNSAVNYTAIAGTLSPNATETLVQNVADSSFRITAAYLKLSTPPGVGKSYDFALRENAGTPSTTFAMNITGTTPNDTASVTGANFTPTDGALYDWIITPTGTPTAAGMSLSMLGHIDSGVPSRMMLLGVGN